MISFACKDCGKSFSVPDAYAGRTARCKGCGSDLTVPAAAELLRSTAGATVEAPRLSPRARRLLADAEQMRSFFAGADHIRIAAAHGDPPDIYEIEYTINSLAADAKGRPVERRDHRVKIQLTTDYPRLSPICSMLTPIFHPNFSETTICIGDHWTAGERLADLIVRIGEMIAYQAYNNQSPLNGAAAMWADLNASKLPTDPKVIRPATME